MKPSIFHSNKTSYNWLIYHINDQFMMKYENLYHGTIVDLGCGEAPYREYFLQFCDHYIGVDWGEGDHKYKIDVSSNLNEKINLNNNYADVVVSFSVLEHLHNPLQFLTEAFRILKDDGFLILQVPWQWWIHEEPHDYYRFTPFGLEYLLSKAGFKEIQVYPQTGFFSMMVLKINYFSLRLVKGPILFQRITLLLLRFFWFFLQKIAPHLDKLDSSWIKETQGYFVIAKKVSI